MPTWTYVKRVGAPAGTINFRVEAGSFLLNDTTTLSFITTDPVMAGELENHPFLTLSGVVAIAPSPQQILGVELVDGVLSSQGPGGTYLPIPQGPAGPPGIVANWRGAYVSSTSYSAGTPPDGVLGSNKHWYISLVTPNIGNDPTTDNGVHWADTVPANVVTDSRGSGAGADIPMNGHMITGAGPLTVRGAADGAFADFAFGAPGTPVTVRDRPSMVPFDFIVQQAGATLTYDSSLSLSPIPMWLKITSTSSAAAYIEATTGLVNYTSYGRVYLDFPVVPAQDWAFIQWFANQSTGKCRLTITPTGKVQISDASFGHVLQSTTVLGTNQKYRIEWAVTRETVAGNDGAVTVSIYLGHSTTAIETFTLSGIATGKFVDTAYFGSVNNSNFGANPLYMAALADGCRTAPGPYTGPPASTLNAISQGGTDLGGYGANGALVIPSKLSLVGNSGHYLFRAGLPMFWMDLQGRVYFGPNLRANRNAPIGGASVPDFAYDPGGGRIGIRSGIVAETNDPPDWTYTRFGNVNEEFLGTDGVVNNGSGGAGNRFSSATLALQSPDVNREIIINGTGYFITSVLSPTTCTIEDVLGNPASLNVTGATWSIQYHPYPQGLRGAGGAAGQQRCVPGARPFIRGGGDGVVNGTTTFTSATIAATTADTGRYVMLNDDPTRLYKLTFVNATTVTLSAADPNTTSGVTWRMCGSDTDVGASPLSFPISTTGWSLGDNATGVDIAAHFASDGSKEFGPVDWYVDNANKALYNTGSAPPVNFIVRYDGRVEIPNRLTFTDPSLTGRSVAPKDTQAWRSAVNREKHSALIDATTLGLASKVKAGTPVDGDWAAPPPDGTLVGDNVAKALWARLSGAWVGPISPARRQIQLAARGLIAETYDLEASIGNGTTIGTQAIYGSLVGLAAGDVITNIVACVPVAGAGTVPTLIKLAIVSTAGVVLAATANIAASAGWTSVGLPQFALTTPYTIPSNGGYYIAFLQNGAFATTPLQLMRVGSNNIATVSAIGSGVAAYVAGGTGKTDITGTLTLTNPGGGTSLWFGVN